MSHFDQVTAVAQNVLELYEHATTNVSLSKLSHIIAEGRGLDGSEVYTRVLHHLYDDGRRDPDPFVRILL